MSNEAEPSEYEQEVARARAELRRSLELFRLGYTLVPAWLFNEPPVFSEPPDEKPLTQ